jgi:large subunit ribosomal protein L12
MENVYAALLLHKLGKEVSEDNMKKVVTAAGAHVNETQIKSLIASLKGVDINKELESASLVAAAPSGGHAGHADKHEAKTEEKKEEKHAAAAEGLSALFG